MGFNRMITKALESNIVQDTIKKAAAEQAEKQAVNDALANAKFKRLDEEDVRRMGLKKGGYVKKADGCAKRGKTKGRMV